MFAWLKDWLGGERTDFYQPRERYIYRYQDGDRIVTADPIPLFKAIMEVGPTLQIDLKVADSISKDADKAHTAAVRKIRDIFSLRPLGAGGSTDVEAIELFAHFMAYLDLQKKSGRTSATSAAATSAPSGPSSAGSPPTPSLSASGSTASGNGSARPEPSPAAPELPKAPSTPA